MVLRVDSVADKTTGDTKAFPRFGNELGNPQLRLTCRQRAND
jgi:hypothetical protein